MADENKRRDEKDFRNRRKKRVCSFCVEKKDEIDLKESYKLRRFMSERAKILPRRVSGTCAKHQRTLTNAIKKARFLALLPYVND